MGSAGAGRDPRFEPAHGAALQPGLELAGRHRLRKMVALEFVATHLLQHANVRQVLDAFGNHFEPERMAQPDDGLGHGKIL